MTVSIRRMTLGSGYKYLMNSVAQSDGASQHASALTRYYAESGTPPGRFIGRGLAGLGNGIGIKPGTQVTEEHLFRMLGMLQDPLTGEPLGRPPRAQKAPYAERVRTRISAETAGLKAEERDAQVLKIQTEERNAETKIARAVAGFDLTFSAPKSVSVAWALADGATQAVIYEAHQQALAYVIRYAEQCVFTTRSGKNGVVQEEIRGVIGAAFDHWDSRAGDPQLHTHVVVMNRAQSEDGVWRTLDSRGMFRATVGLSEMYNGVLSDFLTQALGYGWEPTSRLHSNVPKYEVAGVPEELQKEFSTRSTAIEVATNELIPDFFTTHGRLPNSPEMLRLRQRATLETRPDKHVRPLAELVEGWRGRAREVLGADPVAWVETLAGRNDLPLLRAGDLADEMLVEAAKVAVHTVAEKRATFARSNVFAEVLRQFHGVRFATANDRMAVVERTSDLAVGESLLISPPELATPRPRFSAPTGRRGSGRVGPRSTPRRTCSTPKCASLTRVGPWVGPVCPRSSPPMSAHGTCPGRAIRYRPARGRRCNRSSSQGGSSTSSSVPQGRGRAQRCAGSAKPGSVSTGPVRSSALPRPRPRRRCSPTWWASRQRTQPSGSPKLSANLSASRSSTSCEPSCTRPARRCVPGRFSTGLERSVPRCSGGLCAQGSW